MPHRDLAVFIVLAMPVFLSACHQPSPHERVGWKAEEFFTDANAIALCKAIEAKDLDKIDELIKDGADVNAKGRGNMTPLLWAFPAGEAVFQRLLEHGADPNVKVTMRMRPGILPSESVTHLAADVGIALRGTFPDVAMDNYLKLVLEHGGNPNLETEDGETPLFRAVQGGGSYVERIQMLLKAGVDIDHRDASGTTAAIVAAGSWHYDGFLILLEAGADYRVINKGGRDVILVIAKQTENHPTEKERAVCSRLEKKGFNLNAARRSVPDLQGAWMIPADQRPWLNPTKDVGNKPQAQAK